MKRVGDYQAIEIGDGSRRFGHEIEQWKTNDIILQLKILV